MLANYMVREGDTELGKLKNASYFMVKLPAGPHTFTVHSETEDVLDLEIEPGETYYVISYFMMGIVAYRPNLAPSDQATFEAAKPKLKYSTVVRE
jgi:hypothetical protein